MVTGVADVSCMLVEDNEALVGGVLRRPVPVPSDPGEFYRYLLVWVTDNGSPSEGPDGWNVGVVLPGFPEPSCTTPGGAGSNEAGNLRVRDN